ncbi:hypothetical protein GMOD_00002537 [Pyrenophora seminiperda CCB06]|uniref:Uncharacterized protein n=1 Tax=Pyrenophora seminiperda CCB06 TaxID=1302712 RepID=A0A3M7M2M7_9PLEO|nr:hypothetical protein GMOD_00002537 [Pyrenophora seminiperda CCB06]
MKEAHLILLHLATGEHVSARLQEMANGDHVPLKARGSAGTTCVRKPTTARCAIRITERICTIQSACPGVIYRSKQSPDTASANQKGRSPTSTVMLFFLRSLLHAQNNTASFL